VTQESRTSKQSLGQSNQVRLESMCEQGPLSRFVIGCGAENEIWIFSRYCRPDAARRSRQQRAEFLRPSFWRIRGLSCPGYALGIDQARYL
jgi:hypothetical protein